MLALDFVNHCVLSGKEGGGNQEICALNTGSYLETANEKNFAGRGEGGRS